MTTDVTRTVFHTTVFADGPGGGNPCPIVLDADDLSTQQGLSLAAKYMAETVFVTSATLPQANFRLRYFVPHHEMEMCVHGSIAAVAMLHRLGRLDTSPVQVETALGLIAIEWSESGDGILVTVHQFVPEFSTQNPSAQEVAEVLRLPEISLMSTNLPIVSVSTSRFKLIVPLVGVQTLNSLRPDFDALWRLCDRYKTSGFYPFASASSQDSGVYAARQFPNRAGYDEDPATGVAACALGAYLCRFRASRQGWNSYEIQQGHAMGRPSRIVASAFLHDSSVRATSVTGSAELLGSESLRIPH
jgi:PhzF family phenazine biosynthesis protein